MTGTGTQGDPYIVDTWSDFVTAVGEQSAYVEIAENTVWDMNDILPDGLTSAVNVKCQEIEGNFAEIRNLVKKSASILTTSNAAPNIYRLNFINTTETSSGVWFQNTGSAGPMTFYNCAITGMLTNGKFANYNNNNARVVFKNDEALGCNITLNFSGSSDMGKCSFENCLITLGGKSTYFNYNGEQFSRLQNCYIQGECPWRDVCINSAAANVFDMKFGTLRSDANSTAYKQNIVNADKVTTQGAYSVYLTLVTENQLHDAEYLKSVGFPIL